jgi:hypothetical protein
MVRGKCDDGFSLRRVDPFPHCLFHDDPGIIAAASNGSFEKAGRPPGPQQVVTLI